MTYLAIYENYTTILSMRNVKEMYQKVISGVIDLFGMCILLAGMTLMMYHEMQGFTVDLIRSLPLFF